MNRQITILIVLMLVTVAFADDVKKNIEDTSKNGDITEDDKKRGVEDIQKEIDIFNKKLQELMDAKVTEIES